MRSTLPNKQGKSYALSPLAEIDLEEIWSTRFKTGHLRRLTATTVI